MDSDSSTYATFRNSGISGWQDSNLRLHAPKAWLLATELHPVGTPGGSRTHNKQILSLPPLPVGLQEQVLVLLVGIEPTTYRF